MARKKFSEDINFLPNLISLYAKYDNVVDVAQALNISEKTVRKYLSEQKLLKPRGRRRGKHYQNAPRSKVHEWLKNNGSKKLPQSVNQIAELIGVTPDTVKSYFYRRQKKYQELLVKLEPLNRTAFLVTANKQKIPLIAYKSYRVESIQPNGQVTIVGILRSEARVRASFKLVELLTYLKDNHPEIIAHL